MTITSFNVKLAEISIGIRCPSPETRFFFENYLTDLPCKFSVSVTPADVDAEAHADIKCKADHPDAARLYEASAAQRKIAEVFPLHNRFVMHGAAITYKNDAYLFCAPSGTGKSTHISLWKRYLGADVDIINGDKPILSFNSLTSSEFCVHGSPWAGKERWQKNRSAPLRAICFLTQDDKNSISQLKPDSCLPMLLRQVYMPYDAEAACKTLDLIDRLVRSVPLYHLRCNISEDAVRCSFEALTEFSYAKLRTNES